MNEAIKKLLDDGKITQEEYDMLFEDKSNWLKQEYSYSEVFELDDKSFDKLGEQLKKVGHYNTALKKVIDFQSKSEKIDLNHIQFINYNFQENIDTVTSFSNCKFYGSTSFMISTFHKKVYFDNAIFYGEAEFNHTTFKMGGSFIKTIFQDNAFFNDATFDNEMYFKGAYFEKITDFSNSTFKKLELTNSYLYLPNFNDIKSFQKFSFSSIFANKETARIIKSHYEKHHNIIEANKYFVIEQEKYFEELSWGKDFGTKLVVWLNKIISNHQTSWPKVLRAIIIYILIVFIGYEFFTNCTILKLGFTESFNKAIELIDPLNMFKKDNNLYENHQALGLTIRMVSLYLFWQFLTAFRQNTRRK